MHLYYYILFGILLGLFVIFLVKDYRKQTRMQGALIKGIKEGIPVSISFHRRWKTRRLGKRDFISIKAPFGWSLMQIEKQAKKLLEEKYPFCEITDVNCEW